MSEQIWTLPRPRAEMIVYHARDLIPPPKPGVELPLPEPKQGWAYPRVKRLSGQTSMHFYMPSPLKTLCGKYRHPPAGRNLRPAADPPMAMYRCSKCYERAVKRGLTE